MLPLLLAPAAFVAAPAQPTQGPAVEGWILNQKGKPLQATVGLIPMAHRASSLAPTSTESLGIPNKKKPGFRLSAKPGLYLLDVRAKGHETLQIPVLIGEEGLTDLQIMPVPSKSKGETKAISEDAKLARWSRIYSELKARETKAAAANREAREKGTKATPLDLTADAAALAKDLQAEQEPNTQSLLAVAYLNLLNQGTKLEPASAAMALEKLPAKSPFWSVSPRLASSAFAAAQKNKDWPAFREALGKENEDPEVRATAIYSQLAAAAREEDADKVQTLYTTLTTEYKECAAAAWAKPYNPAKLMLKGKAFPSFALKDLEGKDVSLDSFKNKVVLVDFWSTTTPECTKQMPDMHATYEKYKAAGFEILSLSMDEKAEDVATFRAHGAQKMPWTHVFLGKGSKDSLATSLGVSNLPHPLLVGPDGKILVGEGIKLRGRYLGYTVEKALKDLGMLKAPEAAPMPIPPAETPKADVPLPASAEAPKAETPKTETPKPTGTQG